jgi:hypothetical protein
VDIKITSDAAEEYKLEYGNDSETGFRLYLADKS